MRIGFKKALAGTATLAAAATAIPLLAATPAFAATNNGVLNISPQSGTSATNFTLSFPSGSTFACPGDSATGGYRVQGFVVPNSTNLDSMTFKSTGPNVAGGQPLIDTSGNSLVNGLTDITTGAISQLPGTYSFAFNAPTDFTAGVYQVGVACSLANATQSYWSIPVTISSNPAGGPAQINWAFGAVPSAPSVKAPGTGASVNGNGQVTVDINTVTATPGVTSYTYTLTGPGAPAPRTVSGTAGFTPTAQTFTGLTNGSTYGVSVTATNATGTSTASSTVNFTPSLPVAPAVTGLAVVGTAGQVTASWNGYTGTPAGATHSGFSVSVLKGATLATATPVAGSPFTVPTTQTTFTQTGAAGDVFWISVTPLFSAPAGQTGAATAAQSGTVLASSVLDQQITVTRPTGALVLTQVCGRYGTLDAESAQLGFPNGIPAATPLNDGDNPDPQTGQTPYLSQSGLPFSAVGTTPGAGSTPVAAGAQDQANAAQYPYPVNATTGEANPTYPTWCGVELGAAKFVATGATQYGRGQYFAASGRLNQVTVVDTRDADTPFNIAASVSDFTAAGGKSFSGNQLGWTPRVNRDSGSFTDALGNTYDQLTQAGTPVAQNTPVSSGQGLKAFNANTLIKANGRATSGSVTTGSLGIAVADARLKLVIPVTAIAGNYTAVLTISSF